MPLVTITQAVGCDGLTLAQRVAKEMGTELYDDSRLRSEAGKMTRHTIKVSKVPHVWISPDPRCFFCCNSVQLHPRLGSTCKQIQQHEQKSS